MIAHYTGPEVMSMRDRSLNYLIAAAIAILLVVTVPLSAGASSCEEITDFRTGITVTSI